MGARQVVLITGCSEGGIGQALALAFARTGCNVVATAPTMSSLRKLDEAGIHCTTLDVLQESSMAKAVESTILKFGRIDVLVNNAGIPCVGPVAEVPLDLLEKTFRTNVLGVVSMVQKVVPHMVTQGKGKIANIGSVSVHAPGPWMSGYTASKCAVHAITDAMRMELKPYNIHTILIAPGAISSHFGQNALSMALSSSLKLYKPFEESIKLRAAMSQGPNSTPTTEFANKVVSAIINPNPVNYFSYGKLSTFLSSLYYAPIWLRDYFFVKLLKIDQVEKKKILPNMKLK